MKTPTHIAINYLLFKRFKIPEPLQKYFLIGGALPDLPICFIFAVVYLQSSGHAEGIAAFRKLYETDALVIGLHNLLHSPVSLALLLTLEFLFGKHRSKWAFLLAGCFIHSLVDIYTHVDDGPLMFWPFNWELRFTSVLSHWDSNFGSIYVVLTEVFILCAAAITYWIHRQRRADVTYKNISVQVVKNSRTRNADLI